MSVPPLFSSTSVAREPANPSIAESLLRSLPDWFGIEDATVEYVTAAARLATYLARETDTTPVGLLLVERHFPGAAEVHLMAVDPAHHRAGIGRALLAAAEQDLAAHGVRLVQVKTLGPSRADQKYARTPLFYVACGFQPLEEIHGVAHRVAALWGFAPS